MKHQAVEGFSKLSKEGKIEWVVNEYLNGDEKAIQTLKQYWNDDADLRKLHDEFSENTVSNFYMPFGLAPNFLINNELFAIPMAVEESSVVAAASKAAKFWQTRGGFKTTVLSTTKLGHVHFMYEGDFEKLKNAFDTKISAQLIETTNDITKNMRARGGGILALELIDKTAELANYYQIKASFETMDSMGANFINSCLEQFAKTLKEEAQHYDLFTDAEKDIEVVMSILSNYVPNCIVRAEVSCPVADLEEKHIPNPKEFAAKFVQAIQIAEVEPYRAVTHNKGIMNGVDAVVLATGNDFRAVEAGIHAYAARTGKYSSLSHAKIEDGIFTFWLEIPLALGTIGGLTSLHPLVKLSLEMLEKPSAKELMQYVAVAGLAQNFAALRSLTTTGIQEGHMKMHLNNIINQFEANNEERILIHKYFKKNTVSHSAVVTYIENLRK